MIIGVTGGIASGKSEVCRILQRNGFVYIDADIVAHDILEIPEVIGEVTAAFGNEILSAENDKRSNLFIDRKKLGKIVFSDNEKMNILEKITHPWICKEIQSMINKNSDNNYVIEAIEIVSSGLIQICDELWVVHAEPEQQIRRLMENRHLSYEDAYARIKLQEVHDWDENSADVVIYSTEPINMMELQVLKALKKKINNI